MPVDDKTFDTEGFDPGVMRLETVMTPGLAYTIRELEELTGRTYTRIVYKLRELEKQHKAESKVINHVVHWRLTTASYLEGTVELHERHSEIKLPGRPTGWFVGGKLVKGPSKWNPRKDDDAEEAEES